MGCNTASCRVSTRFISPPDRSTFSERSASRGSSPIRSASWRMATSTSSTLRPAGPGGLDQDVAQLHAGHLDGVLQRQEQPGLGPLPGRQPRQVDAVERHAAAEHLVAGAAGDHMGQRRLARAVRAHHDVHLAGADREVDAPQDLLPGDRHPQVAHLQDGHQPSTPAALPASAATSTTTSAPSTTTG